MKQIIKIIIFMLGLLVTVSMSACGGGSDGGSDGGGGGGGITFSTPDLEGTWYHLLKGSTTYGSLMLGADGSVTGGSNSEIGGGNETYTADGAVSITGSGKISGSLTTSELVTHTILGGQMSRDKGIMAVAGTKPGDEIGLFMKTGSGFSLSNLNEQWKFGNQNGYGTFTVASGVITGSYTAITAPPASSGTLGGTLTITGAGVIGGTFNIGTVEYNIKNGQMSSDKRVVYIAVEENLGGADNAFVAVKMDALFGIGDMATTTFSFVSYSDTLPVTYGTITISGDLSTPGLVIGGNWWQANGLDSGTFTDGTVSTDEFGEVEVAGGVSFITSSNGNKHTIVAGQISATKNFSLNVSEVTGPTPGSEVTLLIKK